MKCCSWKCLLVTTLAVLAAFFLYDFVASQFRLDNIVFKKSYSSDIKLDSSQRQELQSILQQPFSYLDRGRQSYVFISKDGAYVLKFFDARRLSSSVRIFQSEKSLAQKYERLFKGYEVAYKYDRDHTGLLYVQLIPDPSLDLVVTIIDRFGITQKIPLNAVPFVVQKKAIPTRIGISELLEKGNVEEAKHRLRQIVDMYLDEYRHGLNDSDHNFMYNTGFIGEVPVRIDVGRLSLDDNFKKPEVYQKEIQTIAIKRTGGWLKRHYPQYREEILSDMRAHISEK
jgi:hypothetical protein